MPASINLTQCDICGKPLEEGEGYPISDGHGRRTKRCDACWEDWVREETRKMIHAKPLKEARLRPIGSAELEYQGTVLRP